MQKQNKKERKKEKRAAEREAAEREAQATAEALQRWGGGERGTVGEMCRQGEWHDQVQEGSWWERSQES